MAWLLVAIVLGGAAFLLLRGPGSGPAGTPTGKGAALAVGARLLDLTPAGVNAIRVEHADGSVESLSLGLPAGVQGGDGTGVAWTMRVRPAGAAADPAVRWPVVSSRVQALLRHLNDIRVRALPAGGAVNADPRADVVTIECSEPAGTYGADVSSRTIVLRLGSQSVAGKATIEVEERFEPAGNSRPAASSAVVDDVIHLLFRGNAPREWRDRAALPAAGLDASRIIMSNDKGVKLALGRVDGAWGVREPIVAPADPAVVQRLLGAVTAVQIVDFLDQGVTEASARLDRPAATVVLETDRPGRNAPGTTVDTCKLEIGGAADAAGTRLFARIDDERTVVIDARAVADLKLEPTLYVWPFPLRLNAADIGTIVLERSAARPTPPDSESGIVFRRDLQWWKQILSTGQEVRLSEAETRPVQALLGFLCGPAPGAAEVGGSAGAPAGPLSIAAAAPEGLRPWGRISLLSLAGAPLDSLEVSGQDAKPGTVTIRTGSIYRTYGLDRVPSLVSNLLSAAQPEPAVGQVSEPSK